MRVYVESNFVLDLALKQEETVACEELLRLAESRTIELVLPAYALIEPNETVVRRQRDWASFRNQQDKLVTEHRRSTAMANVAARNREASGLLLTAEQELTRRYAEIRGKLLACAELIPIDHPAIREAEQFRTEFGLRLPDALMLASVLADTARRPSQSLFLNRNTSDFDDKAIITRLRERDCKFVRSFADGLASLLHDQG